MFKTASSIMMLLIVAAVLLVPVAGRADTPIGAIAGTVTNELGTAIFDAKVSIKGPVTASTLSDHVGSFWFRSVPLGVYRISVSKTGYTTSTRDDIVVAGPDTIVSVVLASNIRELGKIVVRASNTINTTPVALSEVTAQTFQDQGQIQLRPILEEIPGVTVEIRNGDAFNNGGAIMALGNDTLVTIRGAFSYETASLVDGHALFGGLDNIGFNSAMLNSIGLQRIETVKGPGASSPTINDAIGGSLNYVTIEPSGQPHGDLSEGSDGYGGSVFNFDYRGTVPNGKLGYAFAYGAQSTPGGLNRHSNYFSPFSGTVNGQPLGFCFGDSGPECSVFYHTKNSNVTDAGSPVLGVGFHLVFCCDTERTLGTEFNTFSKLRYHLSPTTTYAFTHMDSVINNDFGGFQGLQFGGPFVGFSGYNGPVPGLVDEAQADEMTGSQQFQALDEHDFQTAALHGKLRLSYASFYQFNYYFEQPGRKNNRFLAYGALPTGDPNNPVTYVNGAPVTLTSINDYTINGYTSLRDYLLQYDLPINNTLYSLSYDRTYFRPDLGQRCCGPTFPYDNFTSEYGLHMKAVSDQVLLRANFEPRRNLTATTSLYFNRYNSITATLPINPAWTGTADGTGCCGINMGNTSNPFVQAYYNSYANHYRYYDAPRLGLAWRPSGDVSWRFAMGGSIAPINLEYSNLSGGVPSPNDPSNPSFYTVFKGDVNLYPETAFGYDLGIDKRLPEKNLLFSGDIYLTNLYGLFNTINTPDGTFAGKPLIATLYTNIANSRYEGLELALRKNPTLGFNWQINGALMRAYAYNLPPHFYDTASIDPNTGQTVWTPYTNNLAVVAGRNFNDGYFNGGPGNGSEASPYSEGYAEVSYRAPHNGLFLLGATYYGPNNSYFRPAFVVLTGSARHEIAPNTTVELSAFNLGNVYNGLLQASYFDTKDGPGVPVALVNNTLGLSPGGVVGPRTLKITVSRSF